MKLYIYRGLGKRQNEKVPWDVTHVIVDSNVTVIRKNAFSNHIHLVSLIMVDNVKRIEEFAFWNCLALRFILLSKTLEYIGDCAFAQCESLKALFLPSTVKSIRFYAFDSCSSLRLLILPNDIDLGKVPMYIISDTPIYHIADNVGVQYEEEDDDIPTDESIRRVNEWLFHHMDAAPFHKLCYDSSITTKHLNDYLNEHGNDSAVAIDTIHDMTPLHMLSMNPHSPSDAIAALFDVNMEVIFRLDNQEKIPLDYARDYNVGGLVALVNGLCNHRNAA